MNLITNDLGTPLAAFTAWLLLAAGVRVVGGRAWAWAYDAVHMLHPWGYRGLRRTTRPALVAEPVHDIGDGQAYAEELHQIVEQLRAEESGEAAPLPLTGDHAVIVRVLQERTAVLPVIDYHLVWAEQETRRLFDEDRIGDERGAELLAEARLRLERSVTVPTGEYPAVVIPRQREEALA